jgi:hypothetical protein
MEVSAMEELRHLREELAALQLRVRELEDFRDISQLVSQYGPSVDSGGADAAADLWVEDGEFAVVGGEMSFTMKGRGDIAAMVESEGHQNLIRNGCAHVLTAPHIEVHGNRATGRSYALNIRWDPENDRFRVARVSANKWNWVRTDKGWKVAERVNSNLDGAQASRALFAQG